MKNITLGIVAHVDSGKTTLSEAILYNVGSIKEYGRVDNKDSFLDNNDLERQRGITIFSKQANFTIKDTYVSLIDTPGHVDFSAEMERTLSVLDYAILVISGSETLKGHTFTLWRLLSTYKIPTFVFVNKMDQTTKTKEDIYAYLRGELGTELIDFSDNHLDETVLEEIALLASESKHTYMFDNYINTGTIKQDDIALLIGERIIFPVYFGSALKLKGVDNLLLGIDVYTKEKSYSSELGGVVFKITKDDKGNRLAHIKVTGGSLSVKEQINSTEKINQLRIYSGEKYQVVNSVEPGKICTALGLSEVKAGTYFGSETGGFIPLIEPILSFTLESPKDINKRTIFPQIKALEEEFPELSVEWKEETENINLKLMGEVQIEILTEIIKERLNFTPSFGTGSITYKETLIDKVIGVGHFEPLRHYAEVHLLMEPGERGSGITFSSKVSEDILSKNWQRLIITHIKEKTHLGVLTGSELTDVHISIINGRAHTKHTEGGDFRQATYRAIRNGLMYGQSALLEPYYDFILTIPKDMVGRAMLDIDNMSGTIAPPLIVDDKATIKGRAPVATMRNYQINLNAYTHGTGSLVCTFSGYDLCHNQEEVVADIKYNPEEDISNPASSVFCSHGAGVVIPWHQVKEYMHVESSLDAPKMELSSIMQKNKTEFDYSIGLEEIDEIMSRTYQANQKAGKQDFKKKKPPEYVYSNSSPKVKKPKDKLLIVDGYNVIFAWEDLKSLADININSAKDKLIQILSNYKALVDDKIILVFDGYKAKDNRGDISDMDGIMVVHTKENQTADQYIESFSYENKDRFSITVATSDGLIQQMVWGQNGYVLSSRDLLKKINVELETLRENFNL